MITASLSPLLEHDLKRVRAWLAKDEGDVLLRSVQAQVDTLIQQGRLEMFEAEAAPNMAQTAKDHFEEAAELSRFIRRLQALRNPESVFYQLDTTHDPNPIPYAETD